jgi:hypothetical protein
VESSAAAGKFSVAGDAVTLAFDAGANAGETFAFRWQLSDDVLTFRRDGSLNLPGPTPFLVTTWARRTATSVTPLADGGTMFPGTYSTRFAPGMTITIGDEVDLDCFPGYRCRGDIDVNLPFWVEFEFGSEHGSDVSIVRMDKIYADKARVRLVDPPNDLARWITSYPGLAVVDGPKQVTVGRLPATQVDVEASKETPFGPTGLTGADDPQWFGAGAGETVRFILLNVGSHAVLIKAGTGFENVTGDFQAAVDGVQPVIDSIVWDDE